MRAADQRARTLWQLAAICLAAACAITEAAAEVELRQDAGDTVYTIRPDRKPGVAGVRPAGRSRRGVRVAIPPGDLRVLIEEVSDRYEMDSSLVTSVMSVESGFDRMAVSPKGARGLMQLMPETAKEYGVTDVHDARQNVEGGVAYLSDLLQRYNGDLRLALAAYNAGPGAVQRAAGVPRYRETRDYLRRIESAYGSSLESGQRGRAAGGAAARKADPIRATRGADGSIEATNQKPRTSRRVPRSGS